jgi:hypothetical protein
MYLDKSLGEIKPTLSSQSCHISEYVPVIYLTNAVFLLIVSYRALQDYSQPVLIKNCRTFL